MMRSENAEAILALLGAAGYGFWQQSVMAALFAFAVLAFLGAISLELYDIKREYQKRR